MTIYLVRHGRTVFNAEHRLQGSLDSPLTATGVAQGRALGKLLRTLIPPGSDCPIVSSPLGRAQATAALIAEAMHVPIALDPRLAEVSMGRWEGLTRAEIEARWPGADTAAVRSAWANGCPGGESFADAIARASAWLEDHRDRTLIAVSHGITGSLLRGLHAGYDRDAMLALPVPQDAVFVLTDNGIERYDCVSD